MAISAFGLGGREVGLSQKIDLNGKLEISRLVDLCASELSLTIQYDSSELKGNVTLRVGDDLSRDELWGLTNHILESRGFTTIETGGGGAFSVVRIGKGALATAIGSNPGKDGYRPGFTSVVVRLKALPAREAVSSMGALVSNDGGSVVALGSSNLILISDRTERVMHAVELLREIDLPFQPPSFHSYRTKSRSPKELVASANEVMRTFEASGGRPGRGKLVARDDVGEVLVVAPAGEMDAWREMLETLDIGGRRETRVYESSSYAAEDVASLLAEAVTSGGSPELQVVTNKLTGTLLITGTSADHARVEKLISDLSDSANGAAKEITRQYKLRNRSVSSVLSVLGEYQSANVFAIAGGVPFGSEATADAMRAGSRLGQGDRSSSARSASLRFASDQMTNSIVVVGDPRLVAAAGELIGKIDIQEPQVLLEVLIVSLTESESLRLGVELERLSESAGTAVTVASRFGLDAPSAIGLAGTVIDRSIRMDLGLWFRPCRRLATADRSTCRDY